MIKLDLHLATPCDQNELGIMKEYLLAIGVRIDISGNLLRISLIDSPSDRGITYDLARTRNAGRKVSARFDNDHVITYGYILSMRDKGMSWEKISEKTQIPHATFFRRKKKMEDDIKNSGIPVEKLKERLF